MQFPGLPRLLHLYLKRDPIWPVGPGALAGADDTGEVPWVRTSVGGDSKNTRLGAVVGGP